MKVWIVYYKSNADKNRVFIDKLLACGKAKGIDIELKYVEDIENIKNIENNSMNVCNINSYPDAVISRAINPALSLYFEKMGIRVFNSYAISHMCNNKALTYKMINSIGITHIATIIVSERDGSISHRNEPDVKCKTDYEYTYINGMKGSIYEDTLDIFLSENCIDSSGHIVNQILDNVINKRACIDENDLKRYVIKSVTGHGGAEVMTLYDYYNSDICMGHQEHNASIQYNDKCVIQPLVDTNGRDLRVYVIGNKIVKAILRQGQSSFKSNFSLGGNVSVYDLNESQKEIVYKIIDAFDFDYVGIDFLLGENDELIFNEIEDVVGARMLSACTDIDYVSLYIEHIISRLQ